MDGLKRTAAVCQNGAPFPAGAPPMFSLRLNASASLAVPAPAARDALEEALAGAVRQVNAWVLGKPAQIRLAFACVLAGGHLLIEDLPGTGKTLLARSLAATLGLQCRRIQFTADLMPSDVLGVSVFQPQAQAFEFHPGPVFTQILLADEINRAPPRTQSALLEAMAEAQVSMDGFTRALPNPFVVLATQNPLDQAGTFPLPAAQKDRFLFQIGLGYPDRASQIALMRGTRRLDLVERAPAPLLDASQVEQLRARARALQLSDALLEYACDLIEATREHPELTMGLSPRAGRALVEAGQALALLDGQAFVSPEHLQEAFVPLAVHRVEGDRPEQTVRAILAEVPVR